MPMRKLVVLLVGVVVLLPASRAVAAPIIVEFPLPTSGNEPRSVAAGPDGNLWVAQFSSIDRVTLSGVLTEFPLADSGASAKGIAAGPDGRLWYGEFNKSNELGRISTNGTFANIVLSPTAQVQDVAAGSDGRMWLTAPFGSPPRVIAVTTAGTQSPFPSPANTRPRQIVAGPDGNLWLTEEGLGGTPSRVARVTTGGAFTEFLLPAGRFLSGIAAGPDGNIWALESTNSPTMQTWAVRFTPSGVQTDFPIGDDTAATASDIVTGPDGNLWATLEDAGDIARISPSGVVDRYPLPTPMSRPMGLTAGPDGNVWVVEAGAFKLARVTPEPPAAGGGGGGAGPATTPSAPPVVDLDAPLVTGLRADPSRFAVAGAKAARAKKAPRGTTFRFTLSENASVALGIERASAGRRLRGKCGKPSRKNRKGRRCTRYRKVGTLTAAGQAGANAVAFSGRIGRRALSPGRYRVLATARDASGNVTVTPPEARFTVVRR